jgi:hypothetical protein
MHGAVGELLDPLGARARLRSGARLRRRDRAGRALLRLWRRTGRKCEGGCQTARQEDRGYAPPSGHARGSLEAN